MKAKKSLKREIVIKEKSSFWFKYLLSLLICGSLSAIAFKIWNKNSNPINSHEVSSNIANSTLKYWGVCIWEWNENGNLRTMNRVFDRLSFVPVNSLKGDDWDVLWSIELPSEDVELFAPIYKQLKPHQRINHFPGIEYMTSKFYMNVHNQDFDFILKSFKFPQDINRFTLFAADNPNKSFVQKNLDNRGVKLVEREEVDFDVDLLFYQEFMDKPFLIDDRTFDLGIFVLIASIDPLRLYRYSNEILLRFCPEPYYPFTSNIEQYVIDETHKHFFEMPSLNPQHERFGYSFRDVFAEHLRRRGHSFEDLQERIDEAIRKLVVRLEPTFVKETQKSFKSTENFFELVRFDFILDEALNVYLMEVNASPNLTPMFKRFENNSVSNEQLVYEVLNLVGASNELDLKSRYDSDASRMISNLRNIAVNIQKCVSHDCENNCSHPDCQLCTPCVDNENLNNMHRAYREHTRRGGFKRLFPAEGYFDDDFIKSLSHNNQISLKWFKSKCESNKEWC